jgi:glycosyltransferase involved in cell wall biosynthesis
MISVLIPVYNARVGDLVSALHRQLSAQKISFEIRCTDDASDADFQKLNAKALAALPHVFYEELPRNIGRARIRHYMAARANYERLLLLDCDVEIVRSNFIECYLGHNKSDVVIGGLLYGKKPKDAKFRLRWCYGTKREQLNVEQRSLRRSFLASNLFIKKEIFVANNLKMLPLGYGHEDTLMGLQLRQSGIFVHHIDNPVLHRGLDANSVFLEKSENAIANLAQLWRDHYVGIEDVRLIAVFERLTRLQIWAMLKWLRLPIESICKKILLSNHSSLLAFDVWRLMRFAHYMSDKRA